MLLAVACVLCIPAVTIAALIPCSVVDESASSLFVANVNTYLGKNIISARGVPAESLCPALPPAQEKIDRMALIAKPCALAHMMCSACEEAVLTIMISSFFLSLLLPEGCNVVTCPLRGRLGRQHNCSTCHRVDQAIGSRDG